MKRIRVIPVIMIDNGRAVITQKFSKPIYVGDPINALKILNDKEVDELVILDITSKKKRSRPDFQLLEKMASESFMPLGYGGHVTMVEDAERLIKFGIEKICFNTALFTNPAMIKELSYRIGRQSIVASIDVSKNLFGDYVVKTNNATKSMGKNIGLILSEIIELGVGEIFLNSVDRDGTLTGYDVKLIQKVSQHINVPLIACGGAASVGDFVKAVRNGKASAVAAGAMFFFKGSFNAVLVNYPDQKTLITELYSCLD